MIRLADLWSVPLPARRRRDAASVIRRRRRDELRALGWLPGMVLLQGLLAVAFFLLTLFAASGEVCAPRLVDVPSATNVLDLTVAPRVTVGPHQILLDGHVVGSSRAIEDGGRVVPRIDEMYGALRAIHDDQVKTHADRRDFTGMINLEIGSDVPAIVVVSVYRTCAQAGFTNVNLVVERRW